MTNIIVCINVYFKFYGILITINYYDNKLSIIIYQHIHKLFDF